MTGHHAKLKEWLAKVIRANRRLSSKQNEALRQPHAQTIAVCPQFTINSKAAKTLGLKIPQSLLISAERVIE